MVLNGKLSKVVKFSQHLDLILKTSYTKLVETLLPNLQTSLPKTNLRTSETVETSIDPFSVHHKLPVYPVKQLILALIVILLHETTVH